MWEQIKTLPWKQLVSWGLLAVVFAILLFLYTPLGSFLQGAFDALIASVLLGVLVVLGGLLGKYLVREQTRRGQVNLYLLVVLIAAIDLSVVSFVTTLLGMINFVTGSMTEIGARVIGWGVSVALALGIQSIMLAISLQLGEMAARARQRKGDEVIKTQRTGGKGDEGKSLAKGIKALGLLIFPTAIVGLVSTGGVLTWADLQAAWAVARTGQGQADWLIPSIFGGLAIVGLGLAGFFHRFLSRVFSNLWTVLVALALLFVYLGTLSISSAFSFDSYLSYIQTEDNFLRRRDAIVRTETAAFRSEAGQEIVERLETITSDRDLVNLSADMTARIRDLISRTKDYDAELIADAADKASAQARIEKANADRVTAIQAELDRAVNAEMAKNADRLTQQAAVTDLENRLDGLIKEIASLEDSIPQLEKEAQDWAELSMCEDMGWPIPRDEAGNPLPKRANAPSDPAKEATCVALATEYGIRLTQKTGCGNLTNGQPTQCQVYKDRSTRITNVDIPAIRERVNELKGQQVTFEADLSQARVILASAAGGTNGVDSAAAEAAAAARIRDLREAAAAQIEALGGTGTDPGTAAAVETRKFDFNQLSADFLAFQTSPSIESMSVFSETCRITTDSLSRVGAADELVTGFDCQPAAMRQIAQRADRIRAAQVEFEQVCGAASGDAAPTRPVEGGEQAPADAPAPAEEPAAAVADPALAGKSDLAALAAIVAETRTCLELVMDAVGGTGPAVERVRALENLDSTYLSGDADIWTRIEDFIRANRQARIAGYVAAFTDLLILFAGIAVAYMRPSPLYENPLDPDVDRLEERLRNVAASFSPDRTHGTAFRIFLNYLEPTGFQETLTDGDAAQQYFLATLNDEVVPTEHRRLVNAILNAIPMKYLDKVSFEPVNRSFESTAESKIGKKKRTAIHARIVTYLNDFAAPPSETDPDIGAMTSAAELFEQRVRAEQEAHRIRMQQRKSAKEAQLPATSPENPSGDGSPGTDDSTANPGQSRKLDLDS